jgi:hypothetical protein
MWSPEKSPYVPENLNNSSSTIVKPSIRGKKKTPFLIRLSQIFSACFVRDSDTDKGQITHKSVTINMGSFIFPFCHLINMFGFVSFVNVWQHIDYFQSSSFLQWQLLRFYACCAVFYIEKQSNISSILSWNSSGHFLVSFGGNEIKTEIEDQGCEIFRRLQRGLNALLVWSGNYPAIWLRKQWNLIIYNYEVLCASLCSLPLACYLQRGLLESPKICPF